MQFTVILILSIGVLAAVSITSSNEIRHFKSQEKSKHAKRVQPSRVLFDNDLPLPKLVHNLDQFQYRHENVFNRYHRKLGYLNPNLTPLYPGYGTHFAYLYVGTPSQRQSVIIDTGSYKYQDICHYNIEHIFVGSHYTAFPCVGCSQCGQHTDEYFDYKNSSTAKLLDCNNNPCVISQSYSEGSSWKAIQVEDKVWVGGLTADLVPDGANFSINFAFGCQTSETGLFRTQLADGIMGLSMADDTLPYKLVANGITESKVFSLCFRLGGGIMTIGGVDQRIHSKPGILYAKLLKSSGWYTVNLLGVQLQDQVGKETKSIDFDPKNWNNEKGCIIDSGTTDSYLPQAVASQFSSIFNELAGVPFTQANVALTAQQLSRLPNILYTFEGTDDQPFTIVMPWTSYVDSVGGGKYAFRIYLTEPTGTVLGANFMNGYNIIFDPDNLKVGFAKSNCKYEEYVILQTRSPTVLPTNIDGFADNNLGINEDDLSGIYSFYIATFFVDNNV